MHLRSTNCRTCDWAFEGGRVLIYPKLATEPFPPVSRSRMGFYPDGVSAEPAPPPAESGYAPPKWMIVVVACPKCGAPMTFESPVSIDVAGARQLPGGPDDPVL